MSIQFRRGKQASWSSKTTEVPKDGQPVVYKNIGGGIDYSLKIGNGTQVVGNLPFLSAVPLAESSTVGYSSLRTLTNVGHLYYCTGGKFETLAGRDNDLGEWSWPSAYVYVLSYVPTTSSSATAYNFLSQFIVPVPNISDGNAPPYIFITKWFWNNSGTSTSYENWKVQFKT